MLKQEINLLLLAFQFYTRLPLKPFNYQESDLDHASRYVVIVGIVVGLITGLTFKLSLYVFSPSISAWLSILVGILATGAFHEDGLADSFDGFGGGWTAEQCLNIMKDSRVGTYGACALLVSLGLKASLLSEISSEFIVLSLVLSHALARANAVSLIADTAYVQLDQQSKVKPIAKALAQKDLNLILLSSVAVLAFALIQLDISHLVLLLVSLIITRYICRRIFIKKLGGYTGDCLGACEQLSEIVCLLVLASLI